MLQERFFVACPCFQRRKWQFANRTVIGIGTDTIKDIVVFHPTNLTMSMFAVTTIGAPGEMALVILSSDGHGHVHVQATANLAEWPVDISAGDFNGDTKDEIAVMGDRGNLSLISWNGLSFGVSSINASGLAGLFYSGWLLPIRLNADPYCDLVFVTDTGPGRPEVSRSF